MTHNLKTKIISKIKDEKPYSKTRHTTVVVLGTIISCFLLGFAIFDLAYFMWDLEYKSRGLPITPDTLVTLSRAAIIELIVITILFAIIIYIIYRRTDLPYVKQRLLVFICIVITIGLLGTGTYIIIRSNTVLNAIFEDVEQQPLFREIARDRKQLIRKEARSRGVMIGRVIHIEDVTNESVRFTLKNDLEEHTFLTNINSTSISEGDLVVVRFDGKDETIRNIAILK